MHATPGTHGHKGRVDGSSAHVQRRSGQDQVRAKIKDSQVVQVRERGYVTPCSIKITQAVKMKSLLKIKVSQVGQGKSRGHVTPCSIKISQAVMIKIGAEDQG